MFQHVRVKQGYELVARRLLGHVVVGVDVTIAGVYREPGVVRAGADPRVEIDARRTRLQDEIDILAPSASGADSAATRLKQAETALDELRTRAAGAAGLEESSRLLEAAREAERVEAERLPVLERAAGEAEAEAAAVGRELDAQASHKAAAQQAELERARWHDRHQDLLRQ